MTEADYWCQLEYRICAEIDGLKDPAMRRYWCDGIIPGQYILDGHPPRILGHAWMGTGGRPGQIEPWDFILLLGEPYDSPCRTNWQALFPSPEVTRWLSLDPLRKQLIIEPSAAVADRILADWEMP